MDQDITISRVLRDLKQQGLISKDIIGDVRDVETRVFLNALWVAAFEYGINTCYKKGIVQYDKYGVKIKEFENVKDAEQKTEEKTKTIYEAIRMGHATRLGFKWKYADNGDDQHQQE